VGTAANAAATAAKEDPSWFDYVLVKPIEYGIEAFSGFLRSQGIEQAYGPSIILFTLALKLLTFPLNKQQIESTTKMQAIQPAAKKLQEKYRDRDPARLNQELQKLYAENEVNPLAGCLPALAQIPIFIGFYRSLLALAKEDKITEGFLWLPSLEGPSADYTQGITWLTDNWVDGHPALGWHDTLCYLVLPVVLVASQYVSTSILTPKSDDPAQQQSQAILKFLPLMIGWFSLNVPSGLGLYWLVNNVFTTASTVLIRRSVGTPEMATATASAVAMDPPKTSSGFGRRFGEVVTKTDDSTGTKVTIKPPGAAMAPTRAERRGANPFDSPLEPVTVEVVSEAAADSTVVEATTAVLDDSMPPPSPTMQKKRKKAKRTKGKKK
jgi:YidC/Oxa1 family membrane protein insertase